MGYTDNYKGVYTDCGVAVGTALLFLPMITHISCRERGFFLTMTYLEWAGEYRESAFTLKERIANLKEQLLTAPADELQNLNFRISVMYQMYLDCMHTADILQKRKGVAF